MGAVCTRNRLVLKDELGTFSSKYRMGAKLGEGRFGQVREASDRESNDIFAVKILDLRGEYDGEDVDPDQLKKARAEAYALERMGTNKYCVQLKAAHREKCLYYVVFEKCEVTLMEMLEQIPLAGEMNLARIFREMLLGIAHVHDSGLVHRDIKPNNFLFTTDVHSTVKLADFGMAVAVPKRGTLKGQFGTTPYMSPEMVGDKAYSQKTDVWSFAVSAYVILFGDFPYRPPEESTKEESSKATKQLILVGLPEPAFAPPDASGPNPSPAAMEFVRTTLVRPHKERPTTQEALQLPFVVAAVAEADSPMCAAHSGGSQHTSQSHKMSCERTRDLQSKVDPCAKLIAERGLDDLLCKLHEHRRSFTQQSSVGSNSSLTAAQPQAAPPEEREQRDERSPLTSHGSADCGSEEQNASKGHDRNAHRMKVSI